MRVRRGDTVFCERFGESIVEDFQNDLPCSYQQGRLCYLLVGDLIEMVKTEAVTTITKKLDVSRTTVWIWRKLLGVGRTNPGTKKMRAKQAKRVFTPERLQKAAKASRSKKERKRKSERLKAAWAAGTQGRLWTAKELKLLGTMPDRELAEKLGRTYNAVHAKRNKK
jgi:hypothetical protein